MKISQVGCRLGWTVSAIVVAAAGGIGVVDVDTSGGGDRAASGGIVRLAVAVPAVVVVTVKTRGWQG